MNDFETISEIFCNLFRLKNVMQKITNQSFYFQKQKREIKLILLEVIRIRNVVFNKKKMMVINNQTLYLSILIDLYSYLSIKRIKEKH